MPLFYSLIHHIPKECFSPLKQSTTAWASLREEDQEQDQQQIKSQVKNLQSKSAMSYINRSDLFQKLFVSKARCPCFIHQNSTGNGAHYTHEHFPPGNVGVCRQSPKIKSGLDSDGGGLTPLCPSRNASSGLWWANRGRLMCWDSFTVPVQQMTQQRP